jgi:hypothetical protein
LVGLPVILERPFNSLLFCSPLAGFLLVEFKTSIGTVGLVALFARSTPGDTLLMNSATHRAIVNFVRGSAAKVRDGVNS